MRPAVQGGRIGRARRIFAVGSGLLDRMACGDTLTGLLPATQSEPTRRHQPIGQDREGLPAWPTNPAPHPDLCLLVVVCLPKSPSVTDDGVVSAKRTTARQPVQRDRPGGSLVFRLGQCDKENQGWREGPPLTVSCQSFDLMAGPSPSGKISFEQKKNTTICRAQASALCLPTCHIGRYNTNYSYLSDASGSLGTSVQLAMCLWSSELAPREGASA